MTDRALILTRQSITGRDDVSLDVQEERCRAYCHERGYAVISVSREESVRGWRDDREALASALELAGSRSYDVLVAWDTSRVARSVRILEQLLHDLGQVGARFESVSEPWVSTPFVRQVLAAVAEEQTRTISRNVSAAKAAMARAGRWPGGVAPFGYQLARVGDGPSVLIPDPAESAIVVEFFRRVAGGESVRAIGNDFRARGLSARKSSRWTTDTLTGMLRNRVYLGEIVHRGQVAATDAHPPLLDADTFAAANRMLDRRVVVRRAGDRPAHWLEGRIQHRCGQRMYLQGHRHRQTASGWQLTYVCASHYADGRVRLGPCAEPRPRLSAHQAGWCARACLVADLAGILPLTDAVARAQQHAGGDAVAQERARLHDRRAAADRRYQRVRDAWADGDEPLAWLEEQRAVRDAVYAETDTLLANLPEPPDPAQLARAHATLAQFSAVIDSLEGSELAPVIALLGAVVVSETHVAIAYHPDLALFVPAPHAEPIPAGLPRAFTAAYP